MMAGGGQVGYFGRSGAVGQKERSSWTSLGIGTWERTTFAGDAHIMRVPRLIKCEADDLEWRLHLP